MKKMIKKHETMNVSISNMNDFLKTNMNKKHEIMNNSTLNASDFLKTNLTIENQFSSKRKIDEKNSKITFFINLSKERFNVVAIAFR